MTENERSCPQNAHTTLNKVKKKKGWRCERRRRGDLKNHDAARRADGVSAPLCRQTNNTNPEACTVHLCKISKRNGEILTKTYPRGLPIVSRIVEVLVQVEYV